ncbi:phage baseplate assembly protein V [Bordetella ansorpii]|uniref:Phage baseplate assembly protein V n=1 Tax=Bordetella ansorpii TaxID=288768 RepID=A0A157SVR6_9BORD|nr:phage baseplate assembly protein V [Bordetella ansorpii]SAI74562.1 phage baseplate assembly protein V [Bordetella ansorpii]
MNFSAAVGRLRLAIARALIGGVDDAGGLQTMQVRIQAGVVRDRVERFQQYGLTSVPYDDAESVALSVGGSTNHVIVISVDDRRYRLRGLSEGEVALYDDLGQVVHLTRGGIIIRGAGWPVTVTDTPLIDLDADVRVRGGISVENQTGVGNNIAGPVNFTGDSVKHQGVDIGMNHEHDGVQAGDAVSGGPVR